MQEEYRPPVSNQNPQQQQQNNQQQGWGYQQWNYYDYGPIGQNNEPPKPKKEKKSSSSRGLKVFAAIMTVLFVITASAFTAYIVIGNDLFAPEESEQGTGNEISGDLFTEDETPDGDLSDGIEGEELSKRQVFKKIQPSVVGIVCYSHSGIATQATGQGSGVIFRADGYIVTNHHVVTDEYTYEPYDRIEVILPSEESYTARYIGGDRQSDLAVLKVEANDLPAAVFGESAKMQVGDEVMAIGNPSGLQLASSFTHGYISAMSRNVYISSAGSSVEFMQTDAAINPGNSGGALVNIYGQVIGITSAKIVEEGFEGIGFAIPIDNAKPIIESLIKNGYVTGRVYIGITYTSVSESIAELNGIPRGLRIVDFDPDSDVAKQGIQRGDIITKMDDVEVYDAETIEIALEGKAPGDTIDLTVYRVGDDGKAQTIVITAELSEKLPD